MTQSSTIQAADLVRQIGENLAAEEINLRPHAFTQAFREGRASVTALVPFVGHQYHLQALIAADETTVAQRIAGCLEGELVGRFLQGVEVNRGRTPLMAAALGMTEPALKAYRPSAAGIAYGAYMSHLLRHGSMAEIVCALLMNTPTWSLNCRELGQALREIYSWPEGATAFVDGAGAIPSFEAEALPIIQAGLNRGEDPAKLARTAAVVQGYEKMFWDAVAAEAGERLTDNQLLRKLSA